MAEVLTAEQILKLAPDEASAKNGKSLANPSKWATLGRQAELLWGECQGSGKEPYKTQIDLSETPPAFKCTCPSRKFPCKHGLGLLLLTTNANARFSATEPPEWVASWQTARARSAKARSTKQESNQIVNSAAQAKRAAERQAKVAAGCQELETWLCDLVRQGLATVQEKPYRFWDDVARRMVDAQAPGLARQVRSLATLRADSLLERISHLYLLIEGFKHLETLPPALQADLRGAIGWPQKKEDALAEVGIYDSWLCIGQHEEELEDNLRAKRTWLWGQKSQKTALFLSFALPHTAFDQTILVGMQLEAEIVFYPSAYPLRAEEKQRFDSPASPFKLIGYPDFTVAVAAYVAALAHNPWLRTFPMLLQQVIPWQKDDLWFALDSQKQIIPLKIASDLNGWQMLALSGGHPVTLFGEWDGEQLLPLSVWAKDSFAELKAKEDCIPF